MTQHLSDRHHHVLKALGGALTLGDDLDAWSHLSRILADGLSPGERAWLFHAALNAVEPDDAVLLVNDVISEALEGPPLPVLHDIEDSARWWADVASLPELRAWLAACFVRLPARDQTAFLTQVSRRIAA